MALGESASVVNHDHAGAFSFLETDEQIIARKAREKAVKAAWREFKKTSKQAEYLANRRQDPKPHPILVPHSWYGHKTALQKPSDRTS